jgi:hypothetical protein
MIKIPADVDTPDKVLAGLTLRQVAVLAGTALILYGAWQALHTVVAGAVFLLGAVPVAAVGVCLALLRRDGMSLDRLARAGLAYRIRPRRLHHPTTSPRVMLPQWLTDHAAPAAGSTADAGGWDTQLHGRRGGELTLPARGVHEHGWGGARVGVIDLGSAGVAVIAACSTVNLALRSEAEQHALMGCFARLLSSTGGPLQIVVRTQPMDLSPAVADLDAAAASFTNPALHAAAAGHRDYLAGIAATRPLVRHVLLVLREPTPGRGTRSTQAPGGAEPGGPAWAGAVTRLIGRLGEAQRCLAPAEISVCALDADTTRAVLASAADPDRPLDAFTTHHHTGPPHTTTPTATATAGAGWSR